MHRTRVTGFGVGLGLMLVLSSAMAGDTAYGSAGFVPSVQQPLGWRGNGDGLFPGAEPPTTWDVAGGKNVIWKTPLAGGDKSGCIVVGGLVVTEAEPESLVAFDMNDGKERWRVQFDPTATLKDRDAVAPLWKATVEATVASWADPKHTMPPEAKARAKDLEKKYRLSGWDGETGWCCATPVTDGTRIYGLHRAGAALAVGVDGKTAWQTSLGALGPGSPLLVAGRLIVPADNGMALAGLDPATGAVVWKTVFPSVKPDQKINRRASGSAPALVTVGGETFLVATTGDAIRPKDGTVAGKDLFGAGGEAGPAMGAAGAGDVVLIPLGDDHGHGKQGMRAVRLKKGGDGVAGEVLWESLEDPKVDKCGIAIVTPLAYEGFVYAPLVYRTACGIRVRNLQTGEIVGKDRKFVVDFTPHHRDASPVMAGGHIVVTTSGGTTIYLRPGADWAEVSRVSLGGPSGATPCCIGKRLYTRTDKELLCLGLP